MQTTANKRTIYLDESNITLVNTEYAPFRHASGNPDAYSIYEAELTYIFTLEWGDFGLEKTTFDVVKFTLDLTREAIPSMDPSDWNEEEAENETINLTKWEANLSEIDEPYFSGVTIDFQNKSLNFE